MPTGFDTSTATSFLQSGLSHLPESAIAHLGEVTAAGLGDPVASAALPVIVAGLVQDKAVEMGAYADQRLSDTAEQLDEDSQTQAALAQGIRGILKSLPDSEQWENAAIQTANGNPESLESLLKTYQTDPDKREEFETVVKHVFSGETDSLSENDEQDDFLEYIQDTFDADSRDEALATFLDVRELLLSREVHQTLETTAGIKTDLNEVKESMEQARNELESRLDSILEANLRDEGFTRLSPYYFHRHDPAPAATSWRAGFELAAVHSGQALEREYATDDGRQKVWRDLRDQLADGEDTVVIGRPGTGKSTICRTVACHWYDEQRGTVFYRESDSGQRFNRRGVIEERIREAEGHALVIVEDAARESANDIFNVMLEFQADDSVSFLLDSRVEEWRDASQELTDPHVLNLKEELSQYRVPKFDENECARALTLFEDTTGHQVVESREELLNEIETDIGAGEMYLLGYRLSSYGINPVTDAGAREATGLRSAVRQVHDRLVDGNDDLARQVGMLINILNAAEIGIYPDLIHSLAEDNTEHGQIESLLNQFTGYILFQGSDRYRSNHPFWSTQYLAYALERDEHRTIHLFEHCLNSIFELIDDPEKRAQVRQWRRNDAQYINEIEQETQVVADSLVQDIFELGQRHPGLSPLFDTSEQSQLSIPDQCSRIVDINSTKWRGEMYLEAGRPDTAESEFQRLLERANEDTQLSEHDREMLIGQGYLKLSEVSRQRGNLDDARNQLKQSIDLFESIGSTRWKAHAFADLGVVARRSGDLDGADEYYDQSIELCHEVGYRFGVAKALNNRGMVEKDRGNLSQARTDLERAIELKRESGHRRASIAISVNTLGEIFYQQGELEKAEQRLEQSLRMKQEIGYRSGCAWSLYYLGLVAMKRGHLETAKGHLLESLSIRRDVDDELGIGRCLNALGEVYYRLDALDRAEAYHKWGRRYLQRVGDEMGQARFEYHMGNIESQRGFLNEAITHFQTAVDGFEEIGNSRGLAQAYLGLGRVARQLDAYEEAREHLSAGLEEFKSLSASSDAIQVVDELINTCEAADDHAAVREWRNEKRSLQERV